MKRIELLQPEFVEFIPERIEDGWLYISRKYATAVHNCCCGCGLKVVTPLKAMGWTLSMDGQAVTLYPSIGNWSFACRSHYWIRDNRIEWSYEMSDAEIRRARTVERQARSAHFAAPPKREVRENKTWVKRWLERLWPW